MLDINQRGGRNPVATFYVEADTSTSMVEFEIFPGDTLVVDRSLTARHGDIVMVNWEGGFTVKQLRLRAGRYELHSGSPANAPILVPEDVELDVWGVGRKLTAKLGAEGTLTAADPARADLRTLRARNGVTLART